MTTVALMAWTGSDRALDADSRLLIERHQGRLDWQPGVAVFSGAAEALAAAIDWQQQPVARVALAVTVAELESTSAATATHAVDALRHLLEIAQPGDILATDVVPLLIPTPIGGRWADKFVPTGASGELTVHQLLRQRPEQPEPITVVVAEDVAIIRAGIVSLLTADGMTITGEAADYQSVLDAVRTARPHLLITDVRMPPGHGDEGLRAAGILRTEQPGLAVLVLSQYVQASAAVNLLTGQTSGIGYLLKERVTALDEFLHAARTVAAGGTVIDPLITQELLTRNRTIDQITSLAARERVVLELMAQGLSNTAIADQLTLSSRTVESHVRSIMTKLNLWEDPAGNRRVQAVIRWLDQQ